MIIAIDVHYKETYAKAVAVLFNWTDKEPIKVITTNIENVAAYKSGEFYKRELPCILSLLEKIDLSKMELIIVDSHVYIANDKSFGLGAYLWKALNEKIPIIGIAKRRFHQTEMVSQEFFKGESKNPLYVSSIGISIDEALKKIDTLHGTYRIPTMLKILDKITKVD